MKFKDVDYETTTAYAEQPIADLLKDLRDETETLVRQEVELAKTELTEKITKYIRNAAYLVAGGLIVFAGFLYLLLAGSNGIALGLAAAGLGPNIWPWLAPLILGVFVMIVGYLFVQKAIGAMKKTSIVPERTIRTIKEDGVWLRKR